ncbi:MAG: FAD:protein FMN transferase [Rikenellaceae bacterium]|nr:FAD:protein FMN transferase [Rikenellaceae bacterium]
MKKLNILISALAVTALSLTGCKNDSPQYVQSVFDGFIQGSTYHIVIKDTVRHDVSAALDSIYRLMDMSMSVYEPNSLISRINRNETDSLDIYIEECIRVAEEVSIETGGVYDITIKPLTAAYGFAGEVSAEEVNVDSLLQLVGYDKIRIVERRLVKERPEIQLDLNSIAQGYTVDLIAKYFDALGLENYIIEMGGEIFSRGTNMKGISWVVGIDKPFEGNYTPGADLQVKLKLSGKGLATSGNYRKFYTDESGRKVVHTVNARTGEPVVSTMLSATVVGPDATAADVWGTVFMIVGLERTKEILAEHTELAAYIVYSGDNGEYLVYATDNLEIQE